MKKSVLQLVSIVVIVAVLMTGGYFYRKEQEKQIAAWREEVSFAFSNNAYEFKEDGWLLKEELENYKPVNDVYNSGIYYEKLNKDEKLIYNAFEYALDNNYTYIYVDDRMVIEEERNVINILEFLSLDSPIVQQNLNVLSGKTNFSLDARIMHKFVSKKIFGTLINVDNFSETYTAQVYDAVEKLKQIKIDFPENATEKDKAWAIFEYIDGELEYFNDTGDVIGTPTVERKEKTTNYLYEAVVDKKTNCDGFANTFSFLCNINGLRCFEKNSLENRNLKESGHTWNTVLIDGEWYNVDCTPALEKDRDEKSDTGSKLMRFGFSDDMQLQTAAYKGMYPECKKGIIPVAYSFETCDDEGATEKIAKALKESEDGYIIVSFKEYDKDEISDLMWDVVYWMYSDIYYVTHEGEINNMCYIKLD